MRNIKKHFDYMKFYVIRMKTGTAGFKTPIPALAAILPLLILITIIGCRSINRQESFIDITSRADEKRIDSIVAVLSLEEKVTMLCGNSLFTSAGIERLGIGDLHYTDGPFGIREELGKRSWTPLGITTDSATFFPTGSALAATWNPDLAYQYGNALGEEAKTRGKDILLGPAINITRTPVNGRTYEYMSEDPFLNARLAVGYVKGVQAAGVASCIKHYAANNQETLRGLVDVQMDERALREIYLPPFKAAVQEGGAYAVMAAYNKFRGSYCAENDYLLNKVLKGEWHFKGMVMSDWGGTHSTVNSALNGLDVEMGTDKYFTLAMMDSVNQGLIPESVINDKVRRILRVILFSHRTPPPAENRQASTPGHNKVAYDVAAQSIVLLKNSTKLLPLDVQQLKSIAIIGDNAIQKQAMGGFGTGVKARYEITPLEGLKNRLGNAVNIAFAQGYKASYSINQHAVKYPETISDKALLAEAVRTASLSDAVILFVGNNREVETENTDRKNLSLPFGQDALIKAVCAANANTVIIVVAGAPVDLHVADSAATAILWSWFNGSQAGNALADVILGKINPSGKLPFTIPVKLNDSPAHALGTFPGKDTATYSEGILVGYRWFDTKAVDPMYCFGYGLSYTDFTYGPLQTDKKSYGKNEFVKLSLNIKNAGSCDGLETVQLYVGEPKSGTLKAAKELKAFKKVQVTSGAEVAVTMEIPVSDLAWFDEKRMNWVVTPGQYQLMMGSSSRDIRSSAQVLIK
jgi:beta-glucosidase